MASLPVDSQHGLGYYSGLYMGPTHSVVAASPAYSQPGTPQGYSRGPLMPTSSAPHLPTAAPQPYCTSVNHLSGPAVPSANSSAASQGTAATSDHYAMAPGASPALYPGVPQASLPAGDPYGPPVFTSPCAPTSRTARDLPLGTQGLAPGHPAPARHAPQQQSPPGTSPHSWTTSSPAVAHDSLIRNHTSSLGPARSSPASTGRFQWTQGTFERKREKRLFGILFWRTQWVLHDGTPPFGLLHLLRYFAIFPSACLRSSLGF